MFRSPFCVAITDKSSQETFEDLMLVPIKNLIGLAANFATVVPGIIQASTLTPNPKPVTVTRPLESSRLLGKTCWVFVGNKGL